MNSTLVRLSILSVAAATFFTACKSGGFQTDKTTGVEYQFIKHNETAPKAAVGNIAYVKLIARAVTTSNADTELYNSNKTRNPRDTNKTFTIGIQKSFPGSLEDGLTMMAIGDSAIFHVNTDSFYTKLVHAPVPKNIKASSPITFYIKMVGFKTQEQLQQEQMAMMNQQKTTELANISKYLADNHYENMKPSSDSVLFLERSGAKKDAPVKEGDSIYVTYDGRLLNGDQFDASELHGGGPLKLQYSQQMQMIRGWVDALGMMHDGEKAKILVPFSLAYGPRAMGPKLPAFSTLVFDLQIIKLTHNKAPKVAPQMMMPPTK